MYKITLLLKSIKKLRNNICIFILHLFFFLKKKKKEELIIELIATHKDLYVGLIDPMINLKTKKNI
jgi:hypothetical protein